jgi:hypothetical protein
MTTRIRIVSDRSGSWSADFLLMSICPLVEALGVASALAFAQFEMKLVISRILLSFEIAMADKRSVRPMRRGLTAVPSPIRLLVKDSLPAARLHRKSLGSNHAL